MRLGRHAADHDALCGDGNRDQAERHLHAARIDKSDPTHLHRRARLAPDTQPAIRLCDLNPVYEEYPCTEDNRWVAIGGQLYLADSEGYLMPIRKEQPPPDPKYLQKYFGPTKK
jgi:hypothetical protein